MTTVRELITDSLGMLGIYGVGRTINAADAELCRRQLNQLAETVNLDDRMVYSITRTATALTPGTGAYTYGIGGTLNTARPSFTESAAVLVGTSEIPLHIMSPEEYADLLDKTETGPYPTQVYMEGLFPLDNVTFFPKPTAACSFVTYSWAAKPVFATINDVLALPPGYLEFYQTNLAVMVAPFFKVMPDAITLQRAVNSRNNLQSMNMRAVRLTTNLPGQNRNTLAAETNGMLVDE